MKNSKKLLIASAALALASSLGGCSVFGGEGKKKETPTIGNRVDILGTEADTKTDSNLAGIAVILPPPATNANWAQPGGNGSKSMGHVVLPFALD